MTTYQSNVKTISSSEEVVFNELSDLNNLDKIKENTNLNIGIEDLEFDTDTCSFTVPGIGKAGFRITERIPNKIIRMKAEHLPVSVNVLVELSPAAEESTQMKLFLFAEIPVMIKMMIDNKLKEGINTFADLLANALAPKPEN